MLRRRLWLVVLIPATAVYLGICALLPAATNPAPAEPISPLAPPRGEIPPAFWEQYGVWLVASGVVLLAGLGSAVWFLTRPKPPVVLPPEIQARQALERLSLQPEDGAVLS